MCPWITVGIQAERINGATLHECPGDAHLLVADHFEEILRTVVDPDS